MTTRILHWIFVALLLLAGLYLSLLGGYLVYLGGSPYYIAVGLALLWIVFCLATKRVLALKLYGSLLAVTLVWSVYEAELDFLALLPRLAAWMVLGCWFLTPAYRSSQPWGP